MSNVFMKVQRALSKKDLARLTPQSFEQLPGVTSTYEEVEEYLTDKELTISNIYVSTDVLYPFWYVEGDVFIPLMNINVEDLEILQLDKRLKTQIEALTTYWKNQEYESFFSRVETQFTFSVFFEKLYEIPEDLRYQVFRGLYVRNDYGFRDLPILETLDLLKSNLEKGNLHDLDVDKEGYVTVYRGQQNKSRPYQESFSWTADYLVAEMFATRHNSLKNYIYQARIHHDNIIDYITDRNESEILLFPEDLKGVELLPLFNYDEVMSERLHHEGFLEDYSHFVNLLKDDWFHNVTGIHGGLHIKRVLLHTLIMSYLEDLPEQDKLFLAYASIYHDIGRVHDGIDPNHGKESVKKKHSLKLTTQGLSKEDNQILDFVIEYHAKPDSQGVRRLKRTDIKDKKRALDLFYRFKDCDGLDRVRLGDLDSSYLRTDIAKKMTLVAHQLLRNIR